MSCPIAYAYDLVKRMCGLRHFPKEKEAQHEVAKALSTAKDEIEAGHLVSEWVSDSGNFPTPADIYGLIRKRQDESGSWQPFQATDCPYCGGSGWYVSKQVGLYTGVSRCDHHGITPKPLKATKQNLCKICEGWGTVKDEKGKFGYCLCSAGQTLRDEIPNWLELLNKHTGPIRGPKLHDRAAKTLEALDKGYLDR